MLHRLIECFVERPAECLAQRMAAPSRREQRLIRKVSRQKTAIVFSRAAVKAQKGSLDRVFGMADRARRRPRAPEEAEAARRRQEENR